MLERLRSEAFWMVVAGILVSAFILGEWLISIWF
jgi:hypothetical protein